MAVFMSINSLAEQGDAMDRMYRFQRHIYDASRRYYLLGREELLDRLKPPGGGSVLEIGCGTGRNLVGVAARFPHTRLFGIDISQEMLKSASTALNKSGCSDRVRLACADATDFNPLSLLGQQHFDRIYFSYTLSMIPDWQKALRHAQALLSPAGELHVVDFGQCEGLPVVFKHLLFRWLKQFHVTPRATLEKECAQLNPAAQFDSMYRGYAWRCALS